MALTKVDDRGLKTPIDLLDNESIRLGTGNDLELFHDGTDSKVDIDNGQLLIRNASNAQILAIQQDKDIFTDGHVHFADNVEARFGNSDLKLYHNGSHSYISSATGNFNIGANTAINLLGGTDFAEYMARFIDDGAVELYHDGDKKFETTTNGGQITGQLDLVGGYLSVDDNYAVVMGTDGDAQLYHSGTHQYLLNTVGNIYIMPKAGEYSIGCYPDGKVELYYDNSTKLETTSSGVLISGHLDLNDGNNIKLGSGDDLQLYHDGTDSYIVNQTGSLYIIPKLNENGIQLVPDGTVRLYYDNAARFETTSTGATVTGDLTISDKIIHAGDTNTAVRFPTTDTIAFETNGTEKIRVSGVTSFGNNNTNTYYGYHDWQPKFQVLDTQGFSILRCGNDAWGGSLHLAKSRGSYDNATAAAAGDRVGAIYFEAMDGTDFRSYSGAIECYVADTVANNDTPGRLVFSTTADGQNGVTERMRLDSNGGLRIGTTTNIFNTATSEKASIKQTTTGNALTLQVTDITGGYPVLWLYSSDTTASQNAIIFQRTGGSVGTITTTASSTAYNTSSDYRLKENVTAISDGITRLKTLKPSRFNFKVDKDTTVDGFLAHEVTAVPEAITGTKDEVDSDKKPVYQGIDQSKLVPLLTAALQEAITKIETLETKVAALEAA